MAFVVVYDANALYPDRLRDLLIRVAQAGMVQAKWTHQILDETFRNVVANNPHLSAERLKRTRELMLRAIRDGLVTGHEPLIDCLDLPDSDDRHVLAAAIKARAQTIVLDLIDLKKTTVFGVVQRMADATKNPPLSVDEVLTWLSRCGLVESVDALRA